MVTSLINTETNLSSISLADIQGLFVLVMVRGFYSGDLNSPLEKSLDRAVQYYRIQSALQAAQEIQMLGVYSTFVPLDIRTKLIVDDPIWINVLDHFCFLPDEIDRLVGR